MSNLDSVYQGHGAWSDPGSSIKHPNTSVITVVECSLSNSQVWARKSRVRVNSHHYTLSVHQSNQIPSTVEARSMAGKTPRTPSLWFRRSEIYLGGRRCFGGRGRYGKAPSNRLPTIFASKAVGHDCILAGVEMTRVDASNVIST